MGLGEGNQAWAGTSAWMSLNIVHADDSFRLLEKNTAFHILACYHISRLGYAAACHSLFAFQREKGRKKKTPRLYASVDTFFGRTCAGNKWILSAVSESWKVQKVSFRENGDFFFPFIFSNLYKLWLLTSKSSTACTHERAGQCNIKKKR